MLGIYAQSNYYYYYKGQKVYLTLDKTFLNISTEENIQKSSITTLNFKDFNLEIDNSNIKTQKTAKLEFQNIPTDLEFLQKINSLKENPNINNVSLYYKRNNASSIGTSNYFYIKLNDSNDFTTLQQIATQKNVQIVKQVPNMPLWYILSLKKSTIGNSLDLANYLYETGLFADVDPAFMFNFRNNCTNDTDFGSLWGLNNSANPNIDINACQAWNISQGNGVKVAVVDQGIDKNHNDLAGNISNLSYNAQTSTSPSIFIKPNRHGTHVAGTIGAIKDNNLQVVGVAPLSKIMSVSHSLSLTPNISAELASGISWAYQNGADVINNSWGDQGGQLYNQLHSTILENAITSAMTLGRNNKGTLIVFAAGNYGSSGPIMDYPSNFNDNIISVGSITSIGARSSFSGYGAKLDIVAPGSNILSTTPNNGTQSLDGTSMASPHVAGVCALILSANPSLTGQQVRDIIEQTSQKIGGYSYTTITERANGTWNDQMGYGLIDAYAAVLMAQCMGFNVQISGNNTICNSETYTVPVGATSYNWSVTQDNSLATITGNGTNSVILNPTSSTASGQITLNLYFGNATCGYKNITKTIWVGVPSLPAFLKGPSTVITGALVNYNGGISLGATSYEWWLPYPYDTVNTFDYFGQNWQKLTNYSDSNSIQVFTGYAQNAGLVQFMGKNACGCGGAKSIQVSHGSGGGGQIPRMANPEATAWYTIYPNPSSDFVNIELSDQNRQPTTKSKIIAELYDLMGHKKGKVEIVNTIAKINVSGLPKGIYILNINIDGQIEGHQIIVE